jgi:hypothetical protein
MLEKAGFSGMLKEGEEAPEKGETEFHCLEKYADACWNYFYEKRL